MLKQWHKNSGTNIVLPQPGCSIGIMDGMLHIHGIVVIDKPAVDYDGRCAINRASTNADLHTDAGGVTGNKNPMLHDNLSRIIRWFKERFTFKCRKINADFYWLSRFYDHIIRSRESHERIKFYIRNNSLKWTQP